MNTLLTFLTLVAPALAEDPEFLMSDLAVRLDLDRSRWHMTRWSTFDFEGKAENDPILLNAWATPVQAPVKPAEAWGSLYTHVVTTRLQGNDPVVTHTDVVEFRDAGKKDAAEVKWAFVDVTFQLPSVGAIALRGATTEIDGQNLHFTVVAPMRMAGQADRDREKIARRMEFTAPVPTLEYAPKVEIEHMGTKLPPGWRALHEGELDAVGPRILDFGVDDVTGCWVALRPRPGADPDVMVTCPRPLHLGIVDDLSFADKDLLVRKKFFGEAIPAAKPLALGDRTGFLYAPRDGLAFAVIPDSENVSVTWAVGEGPLDDQLLAALAPARFVAPHAITSDDQMNHLLSYQWASPLVLCPVGCVGLGVIGLVGGVVAASRRRRRNAQEDDE